MLLSVSQSVQSLKPKQATSRISVSQAFKFSLKSHVTLRKKQSQHQFQFQDLLNQHYSDWVCTAVMSNDVMKDLRG